MEQSNPNENKSKDDIIKEALSKARQTTKNIEDVAVSPRKQSTSTKAKAGEKLKHEDHQNLRHTVDHKVHEKSKRTSTNHHITKHSHENIHEIFESLKELEDKLVITFNKVTDIVNKKNFNIVKFLKEEVFHHLDDHHHKVVKHAEHMDYFKKG